MAIHSITRALIATCILSAASFAQTTPNQNPPAAPCPAPNQTPDQSAKPCPPPTVKKPSAAEQFPFPGETAKPANPPANAPDSPAPSTTPSDAATQHPFPTQPPPKLPGDDSSSSSRSPDDADPVPGDDSATKGDPPEGTSVHRKLPKVKRVQTDDERVDEDLNVAKFYFRDENYQGAYLRAKDAINVQPDYSTPHFVLAQIAQKMKKKDEAIAEYQAYLKLDPEGEKAKEARRALAELQPSGSH